MKLFTVGMISVFMYCAAVGAETRDGARPQPRPRLDPTRQVAVRTPVKEDVHDGDSVLTLAPMVVEEKIVPRLGPPPPVEDPTGGFTLRDGGRLLRRDAGPFRMEVGFWPKIELFAEEARFKPTKVLAEFDFLRIKF